MNKKHLRSILCIVLALSLVFVFAACGSQQKAEEAADQAEQEIDEALDELDAAIDEADAALDEAEAPFMDAVVTLTEDELLVDPDVVINYGDYAAMSDLASAIQNGEMDGALVAIDGDVSQFSSGMSFSITERDEEAGQSIGTTFLIQGAPESAYPADGTRVVIIGKVAIDPSGNFYCINTLPDAVQVVQ